MADQRFGITSDPEARAGQETPTTSAVAAAAGRVRSGPQHAAAATRATEDATASITRIASSDRPSCTSGQIRTTIPRDREATNGRSGKLGSTCET